MKKVVTFGELMLRLAPMGYLRFVQSENLIVQNIMGFFTYGAWSYIIMYTILIAFFAFLTFFTLLTATLSIYPAPSSCESISETFTGKPQWLVSLP